ncbi:hypothetical protein GEMRC1_011749 [Eukaryota sp. GEM-RC1]
MTIFTCPSCSTVQDMPLKAPISLPPTGKDYEWCEGSEYTSCRNCNSSIVYSYRAYLSDEPTQFYNFKVSK